MMNWKDGLSLSKKKCNFVIFQILFSNGCILWILVKNSRSPPLIRIFRILHPATSRKPNEIRNARTWLSSFMSVGERIRLWGFNARNLNKTYHYITFKTFSIIIAEKKINGCNSITIKFGSGFFPWIGYCFFFPGLDLDLAMLKPDP